MARFKGNARDESLFKLGSKALRDIRAGLKAMGRDVAEVDGPSDGDLALRMVQELQAVAKAFEEPEKPAQAEKAPDSLGSFGVSVPDSKKAK